MNKTGYKLLTFGFMFYAVGLMGSMATMSIGVSVLAVGLAAGLIFFRLKGDNQNLNGTKVSTQFFPIILIISALFASALLSLTSAYLFPVTISGLLQPTPDFKLLTKFWYLFWLPVFVLGVSFLQPQDRKKVIAVWWFASILISVVAIQQFFTGWPKAQEVPDGSLRYHATAFFKHHLSLASILIFPFFIGLDYIGSAEKRSNLASIFRSKLLQSSKLLIGFVVLGEVLLFSALILSFSKIVWISLPIGLFIWGWVSLKGKTRWTWFAVGIALVFGASTTNDFRLKVFNIVHNDSFLDRNDLWKANWNLFLQRPIAGVGFRQNSILTSPYLIEKNPQKNGNVFNGHAHSNLIEALSGTGIIGLICFVLFQSYIFWVLVQAARKKFGTALVSGPGALSAFIVLHLNGLTQVNFWEGKVLHTTIWVLGWVLYEYYERKMGAVAKSEVPTSVEPFRVVIDARMVCGRMHGISRYVLSIAKALQERNLASTIKDSGKDSGEKSIKVQMGERLTKPVILEPIFLVSKQLDQKQIEKYFFSFKTVRCQSTFLSLWEWFEIPYYLLKLRAHFFHSPSFMSLPFCPVAHVSTVHDLIHLKFGSKFQKFYYQHFLRPFLIRSPVILTVSKTVETSIRQWLDAKDKKSKEAQSIVITPNVIERAIANKINESSEQRPYLLCLSNAKPHKNLALLSEAVSIARKGGFDWDVRVNLNPVDTQRVFPEAISTEFTEDNLSNSIAGARALVFPSLEEGFGLPPLEAAVQGVRIFVSDIPVHREVLAPLSSNEVGWLDPHNASSIAESILQFWREGSESFLRSPSSESQAKILETYSLKRFGAQLDEAYTRMIRRSHE